MSELFEEGPILTYPGWSLSDSMLSVGARKTNRHSDCAEINGIYTKGYFVVFFISSHDSHCSWQKALDPSHNGKFKFNVNQIISKKLSYPLIFFFLNTLTRWLTIFSGSGGIIWLILEAV